MSDSLPSPSDATPPIRTEHTVPRASIPAKLTYTLILLLAALVAWSGRTPDSDFFMCLAGGQDVAEGRLGKPDTWSYLTDGRIWINQSWLTGWGLYRLWQIGGPNCAVAAR